MYGGVANNQMAMNGFGGGGFPGFGGAMNSAPAGYAQNGGSMGAFGSNMPMNGMGQASPLDQMMSQLTSAMMMMTQMLMLKQMQAMVSSMASFGGGAQSGGTSGISDFLGGSSGGSSGGASSVGGASAPAATSSDFGSVPGWGSALAKDAEKNANGPGGYCFKWVRQALERAGVTGVGGASAYMAAEQLAKNPKFREIKVSPNDLAKLPAGAVVVWDRGGSGASSAGKTHGHISISLGDGREASDKIRKQITGIGSNVRVFLPK